MAPMLCASKVLLPPTHAVGSLFTSLFECDLGRFKIHVPSRSKLAKELGLKRKPASSKLKLSSLIKVVSQVCLYILILA